MGVSGKQNESKTPGSSGRSRKFKHIKQSGATHNGKSEKSRKAAVKQSDKSVEPKLICQNVSYDICVDASTPPSLSLISESIATSASLISSKLALKNLTIKNKSISPVKGRVESPSIELIKAVLLPKKSSKGKKKRKRNPVRLEHDSCCSRDDSLRKFIQAPEFTVISLNCPAKNYEWGKIGSDSYVAQILKDQGVVIDEEKPYAELWMGTHKSGSSCIRGLSPDLDGHPLTDLFNAFPEFIGDMNIHAKYGQQLPFLFKVLSVNKPLSIQVHPDKSLAGQLFSSRPEYYPDPNHKPEMAIALTSFSALAYFRPHDQIICFTKKYNHFGNLIGSELLEEYENAGENRHECLKKCFISLLTKSPDDVVDIIQDLVDQANSNPDDETLKLFKQIADHYPDDVGTFACFFLNHVKLEPGQALFISVNQPHCYLSGDCIEIMACSDNVIRAGLTPKFKDVELLCETMKYKPKSIEKIILKPVRKSEFICLYSPPVDEFAIEKIEIPEDKALGLQYPLEGLHSASLMIIIECESALINSVALLKKSSIYFLPPALNYTISDICGKFLAFRAFIKQ